MVVVVTGRVRKGLGQTGQSASLVKIEGRTRVDRARPLNLGRGTGFQQMDERRRLTWWTDGCRELQRVGIEKNGAGRQIGYHGSRWAGPRPRKGWKG